MSRKLKMAACVNIVILQHETENCQTPSSSVRLFLCLIRRFAIKTWGRGGVVTRILNLVTGRRRLFRFILPPLYPRRNGLRYAHSRRLDSAGAFLNH